MGLLKEVKYWGEWVLEKVREEIGDLYPPIPDPEHKGERSEIECKNGHWVEKGRKANAIEEWASVNNGPPEGYLTPVAHLWTRMVKCKNPSCGATVPLVKQTWLSRKKGRYVAMKLIAPKDEKRVHFQVVEATTEKGLDFDPSIGSKGGNATCPFCATVADTNYVKAEGQMCRMGKQMMAVACTRAGKKGKIYISTTDLTANLTPNSNTISRRIESLCRKTGLTVPSSPIEARMTGGICLPYGLTDFGKLFTPRQTLCLITFTSAVRDVEKELTGFAVGTNRCKSILTLLAAVLDRLADFNSSLCVFNYTGGRGGRSGKAAYGGGRGAGGFNKGGYGGGRGGCGGGR